MAASNANEMNRVLADYEQRYGQLATETITLIHKYLDEGLSVEDAVKKAVNESGVIAGNQEATVTALMQAVASGYGVKSVADPGRVRKTLLHEVWAPDKMNLSARLHGAAPEMRQAIVDTISTAMRLGNTWVGMARDLYDGYNGGKVINQAELPEYLDRLLKQSRRVLAGDKAAMKHYQAAVSQAQYQISKLAANGSPTKALKAAYSQLLEATKDLNGKAIDNAVRVALEEKSRYIAERITRTEISAAWGDGFLARHKDDPDVIAFRWVLSSRHPRYDICDVHANVDLYGLGRGVYPKDKYPRRPAHTHCMCPIETVYIGEIDVDLDEENRKLEAAKFNPKAMDDFLESLPRDKQLQLLGVDGLKAWEGGESWQKHLRSWAGADEPVSRFTDKDLGANQAKKWYNNSERSKKSAEIHYEGLQAGEPQITQDVRKVVEGAGSQMAGLDYRIKTKDSFMRKVESDYQDSILDEMRIGRYQTATSINDAIRYTAVLDEADFHSSYKAITRRLKAKGYQLVKVKNTWNDDGNPYKGVNAVFQSPAGQNFELQFHTAGSYDMKENKLHSYYEEYRAASTAPERRQELLQKMLEMSKALTKPKGVDSIK